MSNIKSVNDKKEFGLRVRQLRKALKMSQGEFAEPLGIKGNTLSEIETGKGNAGRSVQQLMVLHYSVSEDYLEKGKLPMLIPSKTRSASGKASTPKQIPVYGKVPAGFPNELNEEATEYIYVSEMPDNCYALRVTGDSMRPLISDGDYVFFILAGDVKNGDIVIANDEWGESMVKRFREKEGRAYLVSENPEYPVFEVSENHRIVGKVIEKITRTRL